MGKHGEEEERLGFTYDVFISFRGEDTRNNFIGHLRRELGEKGIKSFNDDNMRIGDSLSPALSKAIEESKIFIVVFSKNYASSTRCLDELVRIIERSKMKEKKQLVYPVFYHVHPSDVRHQRDSFGEHMEAHENEIGKESQKMQAWRSALSQAADFPGRYITTGDERNFIKEIVGKVHEYITPKPLYSGQNPVGLEVCIEEVTSLLDMKPDDKTKMDDLLFTSPNPVYSDKMPLAIVPTKDHMKEYKIMHSVLAELERISQDVDNALKPKRSASQDPRSKLRQILDELKNDDEKPKVTFIHDLALIRLKDPVKLHNVEEASTSDHTGNEEEEEEGYDPQLEEIVRDIFDEGMKDGLLEARIRFPSLDILETIRAALEKGYRLGWTPEAKVRTSVESRTYMTGIYSGLLEAKLRFPDLDMWATFNTVAKRKGITETFGSPTEAKSRFPHLDWTTGTPPHDLLMQILMMMKQQSTLELEVKNKLFWKLKEDHQALHEKFAQLENENAAQNTASSGKNQYDKFVGKREDKLDGVAKYEKVSVVLKGRCEELGRLYDVGVEGFQESKEFEDVMSAIYLNGLRGGVLEAHAILLALHTDIETDEAVTDDPVIVTEAPTSGHKESEEEQARKWLLWYEGVTDGVLEAQNRFPSLDIADTISIALGKGSRIEWTPKGMEIIPSAEDRTYLSGVYGGLLKAKLRFPDLEVWETLNTVANRRGINITFVSTPEPKQRIPQLDWTTVTLPSSYDPLMQMFMMMNQQGTLESEVKSKILSQMKEENQVLGNRFAQLENENENATQNTASSSKNQYDELIQKFNIQYDEFVGKGQDNLDHVVEYEKVSGVLKGRGEELERLLNGVVERLLKLEEFEDLISAIYLNGLRDGILEAQVILLALRTDTN